MLSVTRCPACGEIAFPPRDQCARCGAASPDVVSASGRGRVVASTWVPAAFGIEGFGADGFGVAWVDLDGGPRVQVLVGEQAPDPDTTGTVDVRVLEGIDLPVFVPEGS
jgi:uncharacterized OB-fold protein